MKNKVIKGFEVPSNLGIYGGAGSGKTILLREQIILALKEKKGVFLLSDELYPSDLAQKEIFEGCSPSRINMVGKKLTFNPFCYLTDENFQNLLPFVQRIVETMTLTDWDNQLFCGDTLRDKCYTHLRDAIDSDINLAIQKTWDLKRNQGTIDDIFNHIDSPDFSSRVGEEASELIFKNLENFSAKGAYADYFFEGEVVETQSNFVVFESFPAATDPSLFQALHHVCVFFFAKEVFSGERKDRALFVDTLPRFFRSLLWREGLSKELWRLQERDASLVVTTGDLTSFSPLPGWRWIAPDKEDREKIRQNHPELVVSDWGFLEKRSELTTS